MLAAVRAFAARGGPIYAECGGLMYLARAIRTLDGATLPMVGLIPGDAVMSDRLQALGYVEVETPRRSILGAAGLRFRGHQFRYSTLEADARRRRSRVRVRRDGRGRSPKAIASTTCSPLTFTRIGRRIPRSPSLVESCAAWHERHRK